jgi:hypothetical protein
MFEVKPYTPDLYDELVAWWQAWGWSPIPKDFLPADGIVVSFDKKNICAVFMYRTNTPICWAENYISCKDADKGVRQWALDLLIESLVEKAPSMGIKLIMSSINHPVLGKRLEKSGFVVSDTNMTTYMRSV